MYYISLFSLYEYFFFCGDEGVVGGVGAGGGGGGGGVVSGIFCRCTNT